MSTGVPFKLFKYQPLSDRTLTSLKSRTVWFGRPSRLNDPFDCEVPFQVAPISLDDCRRLLERRDDPDWTRFKSDLRYVDLSGNPTERMRAEVDEAARSVLSGVAADTYADRGVTCFSDSPLNTLLWSHYGGGHRGVCLEFETASPGMNKFHPVRYSNDAPQINLVDILLGDHSAVLWGLLTKASCWSYEREWRAIHAKADTEYCYGVEALTGVYLGARLSESEVDLICHILHGTPAKLYRVSKRDRSFELVASNLDYEPYKYKA